MFNWIKSYLTDRVQYVEYNGATSSKTANYLCSTPRIDVGTASVSVIYQYLAYVSKALFCVRLADDANFLITGTNLGDITITLHKQLRSDCALVTIK